MTLALVMFIWGMYKYGMRIYRRFALTGDRSMLKMYSAPIESRPLLAHCSPPARPSRLFRARLVALCSSALPG